MPGLSLAVQPTRMHLGTEIQAFSYAVDPSAAQPGQPFQPAQLKWMESMRWELAYVGDHLVYAVGGPEVMNDALARLAKGGKSLAESVAFTRFFPQARGKIVEMHTLSLSTLLTQVMGMLPNVPPALLAAIPTETAGMAGYSMVAQASLIGVDSISISEIKALQSAMPTIGAIVPTLLMPMVPSGPGAPVATVATEIAPQGE